MRNLWQIFTDPISRHNLGCYCLCIVSINIAYHQGKEVKILKADSVPNQWVTAVLSVYKIRMSRYRHRMEEQAHTTPLYNRPRLYTVTHPPMMRDLDLTAQTETNTTI